jgi:hypothetical protein
MSACDTRFDRLSERVNRELYCNGYAILGRIDRETLLSLRNETNKIKKEIIDWRSGGRLFALIDTYRSLFLRSNKIVEDHMGEFVRGHFSMDQVVVHAASHFVKPVGKRGKFLCHQDSSIVEEPENFAVNAWMPLNDVSRINGCVWALPGSHIYPFYTRYAGNNPYSDPVMQKELWARMRPVPMKAGEILLFHRSLFHGSSINYLPFHRMAIESVILPRKAQLIVNYKDETVPADKIIMFNVTKEHFFENDDPRGKMLKEMKDYVVKDFQGNDYANGGVRSWFPKFAERAQQPL